MPNRPLKEASSLIAISLSDVIVLLKTDHQNDPQGATVDGHDDGKENAKSVDEDEVVQEVVDVAGD